MMETQPNTILNTQGKENIIINEICPMGLQQYNSGERNLPHSTFFQTPLRTAFTMLEMLLNKPQMVQGQEYNLEYAIWNPPPKQKAPKVMLDVGIKKQKNPEMVAKHSRGITFEPQQ